MSRYAQWSAALLCCLAVLPLHAQTYPTRALRMIVPFPPGGPNDILGRVISQKMSESMGHQVVVDNRGGAGGIIETEAAAKGIADGGAVPATLAVGATRERAGAPN